MDINHAYTTSFYRDFYAVDVKSDGTVHLHVKTLNIFQRALRYVFGAYSNTIWNESKSNALKEAHPKEWKQIQNSIVDPKIFANVFKIEKGEITPFLPTKPAIRITPNERPTPSSMSNWKQFGRTELQAQLKEKGLEFREAVENGDCYFDTVAYLLTKLRGDKQYTAQDVRTDIAHYLQSNDAPHDTYRKIHKTTLINSSYEEYCTNIAKSANDVRNPIWGDELAIQAACDLYKIAINVQSAILLETSLLETLEGGQFEDFPFTLTKDNSAIVCTKLNSKDFAPLQVEQVIGSFTIANLAHGPWAHFMPVVPKL